MTVTAILIVEDNDVTRKMMRLTLRAEGYDVLEAGDGGCALWPAIPRDNKASCRRT